MLFPLWVLLRTVTCLTPPPLNSHFRELPSETSLSVLHGDNFTFSLRVIKAEEKQDIGLMLNSLSSPHDYFLKEMLKKIKIKNKCH